jgi:branched-chain amino acid transport system permease protein
MDEILLFIRAHTPLFNTALIGIGYAYSQYIVLRSGTFSVATVGFAAIGGYAAAISMVKFGFHPLASIGLSTLLGLAAGLLISIPLARVRGVYQAIATLAFVQIVESLNFYFEDLTGGPLGMHNIPRQVTTLGLLIAVVAATYLMWAINRGALGRVFEAMRQDVAVAASLGVNPQRYHVIVFALSGALAGLFGSLDALHNFSLTPEQFGFGLLVAVISYVVLGGRRSIIGPIVGAVILVALPEIARPLQDNRTAVYGLILVLVMVFLPYGVADTALRRWRNRKLSQQAQGAPAAGGGA